MLGIFVIGWLFPGALFANSVSDGPRRIEFSAETLPTDPIEDIVRDQAGFLWLATQRGLVRYDSHAVRWYRHDLNRADSLSSSNIRVLYVDREDRLWVGTSNGLNLMDRDKGTFTRFLTESDSASGFGSNIWCVYQDRNGSVWVGTDSGLFRFLPEPLMRYAKELGNIGGDQAMQFGEDASGRLWVATFDEGLFYFDEQKASFIQGGPQNLPKSLTALSIAPDGGLWIGTQADGLYYWHPERGDFRHERALFLADGEATPERIVELHFDRNERLWVAADSAVFRTVTGNGEQRFQSVSDVSTGDDDAVKIGTLFADSAGLIWIATENGELHLFNAQADQVVIEPNYAGQTWAVHADDEQTVWIGVYDHGLLEVTPSGDRRLHLEDRQVRSIYRPDCTDGDSPIFLGTTTGLLSLDLTSRSAQITAELLPGKRVWALTATEDRDLWILGLAGVFRLHDWRLGLSSARLRAVQTGVDTYHTAAAISNNGTLWLGTYAGLLRYNPTDDSFDHFAGAKHGFLANDINHVATDKAGFLWIATHNGGLHRFDPVTEMAKSYSLANGLPDNTVATVAIDPAGRVWAASGNGLVRLDPTTDEVRYFQTNHGFAIGAFAQGSIAYDPLRTSFWIGGLKGVARFDPLQFQTGTSSQIIFTGLRKGGKLSADFLSGDLELKLNPNEKSIAITAVVSDYLPSPLKRLEFQREGIDDDWVVSDVAAEINYTRVLPLGGESRLRVRAKDSQGNPLEAEIKIIAPRPWWIWWSPLLALLFAAAIAALSRWAVLRRERLRRERLEEKARLAEQRALVADQQKELEVEARRLQEENTRILQQYLEQLSTQVANDLHDGPLGTLQGLSFRLNGLREHLIDENALSELNAVAEEVLPHLNSALRNLCGELLLPDFDYGVAAAMEQYADVFETRHPDIRVSCHFEDDGLCLLPECRAMLYRIYRTSLKNAGQHSSASEVDIHMASKDGFLWMTMRDDGRGFRVPDSLDSLKQAGHFGLYMSHYFAARTGGEYQIESSPGSGTLVRVAMPVKVEQEVKV